MRYFDVFVDADVLEDFLFGRVIVSAEDFEAFAELVLDDGSVVCFSVNDLSFVGNQEFGVVRGCGFVIFRLLWSVLVLGLV